MNKTRCNILKQSLRIVIGLDTSLQFDKGKRQLCGNPSGNPVPRF